MPRPRPSVLQVLLALNPGGTERLVLELVKRLRSEFPMSVCCLDVAGTWGEALSTEGTPVRVLNRQPGFHPGLGMRLRAVARDTGATVLHCHQYSPFVYACLARTMSPGLRLIFTEHGRLNDAPPSSKRRVANPALGLLATRILSVSHDLKRHMVAEGLPASRIDVVHNGIDVGPRPSPEMRADVRRALGVTADTCVLVTIARLDPVKDLGTLIRAVAALRAASQPVALVIVGDGPERQSLESLVADLSLQAVVTLLGHRDDARRWLAGGDIYVNSSISEGVSLTLLEAMAAGLPVIATSVGGTPEVIDGTSGRLVPPRDSGSLAAEILTLVRDGDARAAHGRAARHRVESSFTLDAMIEAYARLYDEVA